MYKNITDKDVRILCLFENKTDTFFESIFFESTKRILIKLNKEANSDNSSRFGQAGLHNRLQKGKKRWCRIRVVCMCSSYGGLHEECMKYV
jgi:hypothetical protein